jgi:hypothetical protein
MRERAEAFAGLAHSGPPAGLGGELLAQLPRGLAEERQAQVIHVGPLLLVEPLLGLGPLVRGEQRVGQSDRHGLLGTRGLGQAAEPAQGVRGEVVRHQPGRKLKDLTGVGGDLGLETGQMVAEGGAGRAGQDLQMPEAVSEGRIRPRQQTLRISRGGGNLSAPEVIGDQPAQGQVAVGGIIGQGFQPGARGGGFRAVELQHRELQRREAVGRVERGGAFKMADGGRTLVEFERQFGGHEVILRSLLRRGGEVFEHLGGDRIRRALQAQRRGGELQAVGERRFERRETPAQIELGDQLRPHREVHEHAHRLGIGGIEPDRLLRAKPGGAVVLPGQGGGGLANEAGLLGAMVSRPGVKPERSHRAHQQRQAQQKEGGFLSHRRATHASPSTSGRQLSPAGPRRQPRPLARETPAKSIVAVPRRRHFRAPLCKPSPSA